MKSATELGPNTRHQRDVTHLVCEASLLDGSDGVTTAHDGDSTGGGDVSQRLRDRVGSLGEGGELEHAGGSIPDHGLGGGQGVLDQLDGVRPDVQTLRAQSQR